jgi:hypothetical protein
MPCVRFKTTCPFTCGGTGNGGPGGGGACDPGGPGGRIGCCEAPLSGGSLASLAGGPPYKFGNCKFATDKSIIRYPNRTCTSTTATNALIYFRLTTPDCFRSIIDAKKVVVIIARRFSTLIGGQTACWLLLGL